MNFATLGRSEYRRRLLQFKFKTSFNLWKRNLSLYLIAPGRRQILYFVFPTLQNPVFLINSRYLLFCATKNYGSSYPEVTR